MQFILNFEGGITRFDSSVDHYARYKFFYCTIQSTDCIL